jgi:hypothetical protein
MKARKERRGEARRPTNRSDPNKTTDPPVTQALPGSAGSAGSCGCCAPRLSEAEVQSPGPGEQRLASFAEGRAGDPRPPLAGAADADNPNKADADGGGPRGELALLGLPH